MAFLRLCYLCSLRRLSLALLATFLSFPPLLGASAACLPPISVAQPPPNNDNGSSCELAIDHLPLDPIHNFPFAISQGFSSSAAGQFALALLLISGSAVRITVSADSVILAVMAAVAVLILVVAAAVFRRWRYPLPGGGFREASKNFERFHDWCHTFFSDNRRTIALGSTKNGRRSCDAETDRTGPGPVTFLTVDPENVEYILKSNFANYPKGEKTREKMRDLMGDGIFNVDGDQWRVQRRIASSVFMGKTLKDYSVDCFRQDAVRLLHVLREAAVSPSSTEKASAVNIQALLMSMTMETICRLGFGVNPAALPLSKESEVSGDGDGDGVSYAAFSEAFDKANECIARRYVNAWWKIEKWLRIGTEGVLRKELKKIEAFTERLIKRRFADITPKEHGRVTSTATPPTGKSDLLSCLIQTNAYSAGTINGLRDSIINFMIAGRDTIAVTMSWFIYNVCQNEDVKTKIYQEIEDVLGCCKCVHTEGFDFEEVANRLTYETLSKMHYLHAALTETLRLHPAVPRDTKVALNDDILPDGTLIKAGDHVAFVPYSMGRMKFLWGDDVLDFKPERWLKDGKFYATSPFKFAVFQGGPRMCLGKDWAYLQMKMTMALMLYFFEFKVVSKDVKYRMMMILAIDNGLQVVLHSRKLHNCETCTC